MTDIFESISLFCRNHVEHIVTGISKMHVPLMHLEVCVCQPTEDCVHCSTNDSWWMGLDVRSIYCSKYFFSLLTFMQTFKQITLYKLVQVKPNMNVNYAIIIIFYSVCFFSKVTFFHYLKKKPVWLLSFWERSLLHWVKKSCCEM
jgi:hypothetical protein